jgi:hypothetical protein
MYTAESTYILDESWTDVGRFSSQSRNGTCTWGSDFLLFYVCLELWNRLGPSEASPDGRNPSVPEHGLARNKINTEV